MHNLKISYINKNLLLIVYFIFLFSEITTKFLEYLEFENFRVSVFFKVLFIGFYTIFFAVNFKKLNKKTVWFLSILFFLFLIGNLSSTISSSIAGIKGNLLYFVKYSFIFILYDFYKNFNQHQKNKLFKVIEIFIIINSIVIIIGVLFDLDFFQTYLRRERFGYNGLMYMNSQSSYIYIFLMAVYATKYNFTKIIKFKYILITVAAILTGAKAVYLFVLFMSLYFFFKNRLYTKLYTYAIAVLIILSWSKFVLPVVRSKFSILADLYDKSGLFTMLLSNRDIRLQEIMVTMSDKWNLFIGGLPFFEVRTEMALVDIVLFFGIIGTVYYLYNYYYFLLKELIQFNKFYIYYLFSVIFLILSFGGNYFTNAITAIYIIASIDKLKQLKY